MKINNNSSLNNSLLSSETLIIQENKVVDQVSISNKEDTSNSFINGLSGLLSSFSTDLNINLATPNKVNEKSLFPNPQEIEQLLEDLAFNDSGLKVIVEKLAALKAFVKKSKEGKYDELDLEYLDKLMLKLDKLLKQAEELQAQLREIAKAHKINNDAINLKFAEFFKIADIKMELDAEIKEVYERVLRDKEKSENKNLN